MTIVRSLTDGSCLFQYYDLEYAKLDEGFVDRVKKERRKRAMLKREGKDDNNRRRAKRHLSSRSLRCIRERLCNEDLFCV